MILRRQRDDLIRIQPQKERLMAFVVHNLKNPVNAMDLHAQVLLHDRKLPARVLESAQHIGDSARARHSGHVRRAIELPTLQADPDLFRRVPENAG
jgi:signal transduction histidine kinase